MANNELLELTIRTIELNPDRHEQGSWFDHKMTAAGICRTTYCFAGHAAILAGAESPPAPHNDKTWYVDGIPVAAFAEQQLGLVGDQALVLFDGEYTRAELRIMVDMIKEDPDICGVELSNAIGFWSPEVERC